MNERADYAEPATTSGAVALANLSAQISGREAQAAAAQLDVAGWASLIDLLLLRGHLLGRIADYERALALAEQLVRAVPAGGIAFLVRARVRATFHRFAKALANLDMAERLGVDQAVLADECAAIIQAIGRYDEALALRRHAAECRPDFSTLGALAGLLGEDGQLAEAEALFTEARRHYRDVSPFPLAMLDFQRGRMWLDQGDLAAAQRWFDAALSRVPDYVPALGHLAEVDAACGERAAAIARLYPLAASSDDPEYAGLLAGLLREAGRFQEARRWRITAAARYEQLLERHPAAFAEHAAEFWLAGGSDVRRACQLARQNLELRQTPRAQALVRRAALVSAAYSQC